MLRNTDIGGAGRFPGKSVSKMYYSKILALRGGGWVSNFQVKRYVTLEWPHKATLEPSACLCSEPQSDASIK